ncbi:alpha/beta-hydrolases superfamily protein [Anaeramoeba flamelloides]|uniref:Alpha/beta-hydrolases superfamily protein n=1 Tax=Anaeramoeba flamelloides TaxID=1746091 RepID=A0ABQ8Z3W3_9EUKA|nr:alpha/beta-hydrolases superfamily protein [Anaeramoeba flamelloides]
MQSKYYEFEFEGQKQKLHYLESIVEESNHLLFLIHGLGCNTTSFLSETQDFESFLLKKYSIVLVDLVGFGQSQLNKDTSLSFEQSLLLYSMNQQAELLKDMLLNTFRINDPITTISIIGHSMGGGIGLLLIEKLMNHFEGNSTVQLQYFSVEGNLIANDSFLSKRVVDSYKKNKTFTQEDLNNFLLIDEEWGKMAKLCSPTCFLCSCIDLVKVSFSGELFDLLCKLAINKKIYIYGEKSENKKLSLRLEEKQLTKYKILNAGHMIMKDQPSAFWELISQLLD